MRKILVDFLLKSLQLLRTSIFIKVISHTIDGTCLVGYELTRVFIIVTSSLVVCNEIAFNLFTFIIKVEVLTIDDLIEEEGLTIVTEVVPVALPIEELIGYSSPSLSVEVVSWVVFRFLYQYYKNRRTNSVYLKLHELVCGFHIYW